MEDEKAEAPSGLTPPLNNAHLPPETIPLAGLFRVAKIQRKRREQKEEMDKLRKENQGMLEQIESHLRLERKQRRVSRLTALLETERAVQEQLREANQIRREEIRYVGEILRDHYQIEIAEHEKVQENEEDLKRSKERLKLLLRKCQLRRHKMVYTLTKKILPLKRTTPGKADLMLARADPSDASYKIGFHGVYLIRSWPVMIGQMMSNQELDRHYATGLGFICHLVNLLARYLGVPLKSQIVFRGSRSQIVDPTHPQTTKKQQDVFLPMYTDSTQNGKTLCEQAGRLLSQDVRQLARACNLKPGYVQALERLASERKKKGGPARGLPHTDARDYMLEDLWLITASF